jgi:hypothetical protein
LAGTAYSWVVDGGHRGHSLALLSAFLKQAADLVVFTTVNASAEAILRAYQLQRIPVGQWDTARFWITGYRGFARSAILAHSIPFPGVWSPPVAGALWIRDRLSGLMLPGEPQDLGAGFGIEVCNDFDRRFEPFWKTLEHEGRGTLLAVRDRETLSWRYQPALSRGTLWVVAATLNGRIVAYWIVDRQDHHELGLKRLRFVDFQALAGFEHLLQSAVRWTVERCRQEGLHVADNLGGWLERYRMAGIAGPYRRRMKAWLFYYRALREELAQQLTHPHVWRPSSYDGDASL